MKNSVILLILTVFVISGLILWKGRTGITVSSVTIGDDIFTVDIADSVAERMRGLSGRQKLGANQGMWFAMGDRDRHEFWMKEMSFPLDILWIDGNVIVDIAKNVPIPVGANIPRVRAKYPADSVLEINAGEVARRGISIGDKVELK